MKNKIINSVILMLVVGATIEINLNLSQKDASFTTLLSNVEALADPTESGATHECYDSYSNSGKKGTSRHERVCDGCTYKDIFKPKNNTTCPK